MNEPSFNDERGLHLVAEMQRPQEIPKAMPNISPLVWACTLAGGAAFWYGAFRLLVNLWCCR
jgi:hypothetical protein